MVLDILGHPHEHYLDFRVLLQNTFLFFSILSGLFLSFFLYSELWITLVFFLISAVSTMLFYTLLQDMNRFIYENSIGENHFD